MGFVLSATQWFINVAERGGPNTPSDFNLFEISRYSVPEWGKQVSADPCRIQCTVVPISEVGNATKALSDAIKQAHNLASGEVAKLFDDYLGAACPECFGGLTGSLLQLVAAGSSAAGVTGGGAQFQRVLSGRCASCESDTYYVIWHGDKSARLKSVTEGRPTAARRKSWPGWTGLRKFFHRVRRQVDTSNTNARSDDIESILRASQGDAQSIAQQHALLRSLGPQAADHLVTLASLLVSENEQTKALARSALHGVMDAVVPAVLSDLRSADPSVRFIGVTVLSELAPITDPAALKALRLAARDSDDAVAMEAIMALQKSD